MRKNAKILRELRALAPAHIDPKTGELNMTSLVEAWDRDQGRDRPSRKWPLVGQNT